VKWTKAQPARRIFFRAPPCRLPTAVKRSLNDEDEELEHEICDLLADCLRPGGALVLGAHETLPAAAGFEPWAARLGAHSRPSRSNRPMVIVGRGAQQCRRGPTLTSTRRPAATSSP
jgi:hypothetical protein